MADIINYYFDIPAARKSVDLGDKIQIVDPDITPFLAFMKGKKWGQAIQPKFGISYYSDPSRLDQVNGAKLSTDTSIVVDHGDRFQVNDIIELTATAELAQVTAVSGNTLTVIRGVGLTTPADILNDAVVFNHGPANKNGIITAYEAISTTERYNFTQMFQRSFKVDIYNKLSKTLPENTVDADMNLRRKSMWRRHQEDIDYTFLFGSQQEGNATTPYMTDGIIKFIPAENTATYALSTLTDSQLMTFVRKYAYAHFGNGGMNKVMLCGGDLYQQIHELFQGKLVTSQASDYYGVNITKINAMGYTLGLVNAYDMKDIYLKDGIVFDPVDIDIKALLRTQLLKGIQAKNDTDYQEAYITIAGLDVKNPMALARFNGT